MQLALGIYIWHMILLDQICNKTQFIINIDIHKVKLNKNLTENLHFLKGKYLMGKACKWHLSHTNSLSSGNVTHLWHM